MGLNEDIAHRMRRNAVDVERFSRAEAFRLAVMLAELQEELTVEIARVDPTGVERAPFRRARLEKLLAVVTPTIAATYRKISGEQARGLRSFAKFQAGETVDLINDVARFELVTDGVNPDLLRSLVKDTAIEGAPLADWWAKQGSDLTFRFRREMTSGVLQGETVGELANRVKGGGRGEQARVGIMQTSRREAQALVRTSVNQVSNNVRRLTYEENDDVVKAVQQISTLDGRTSDICKAYSGKQWSLPDYRPIDHDLPWNNGPPRHVNCFPGDTLATPLGEVLGVTRRWYRGPLVDVSVRGVATGAKARLRVTPNHPILTRAGWKRAGQLTTGEEVAMWIRNVTEPEGEARAIAEIAERFASLPGASTDYVRARSGDFHGDGIEGVPAIVSERAGVARGEPIDNDVLAAAVWNGLVGAIEAAAVESIATSPYGGSVFNLETSSGCYAAGAGGNGGVVVHNCRSTIVPVTKSWEELARDEGSTWQARKREIDEDDLPSAAERRRRFEEGLRRDGFSEEEIARTVEHAQSSLDGQVSEDLDYEAWLKTQPESYQRGVLGKGRHELWKAGRITFADLVDASGSRPVTIADLERKSSARTRARSRTPRARKK